ncbi:MAG TPA: hypothetical protein VN114_06930 [Oxalicibacterium sp.]|uniref:hypothetical protein n=1 Tax=Oxalicibacterium sp. TaxID=2766525 RepID=UPI002B593172|nr:hypothetical protein [Oxalicibacterium sp.]HWU98229.1 hypothetical protein [Oxalicibacterium sp.]
MHIDRTHHIDTAESDENGDVDYFYEYDIYRFSEGSMCLFARSYIDEPDEAHFLNFSIDGESQLIVDADLTRPLLVSAKEHLLSEGKVRLHWLSGRGNGYEPLP